MQMNHIQLTFCTPAFLSGLQELEFGYLIAEKLVDSPKGMLYPDGYNVHPAAPQG